MAHRRTGTKETKPEYSIKRAEELIALNNKTQALDVLATHACRKRQWTKPLEFLMVKLLSLCVEMNNKNRAKDALYHYRNACSTSQTQSLDTVLRHFLTESESHAQKSPETSTAVDSSTIKLLKAVGGEDTQILSERELVVPHLKFLWETYRTVLDVLRNDRKQLYMETCKKAFEFCKVHRRPVEFKRLAEVLRTHLIPHPVLAKPVTHAEILEMAPYQLEVYFSQLNTAMELELWQEAYKSIDDIKTNVFSLNVYVPRQTWADYYRQLSKLFWVSKNYFFHTYALSKYLELMKEIENGESEPESPLLFEPKEKIILTEEEKTQLHSKVLLSALSIPLTSKIDDDYQIQFNFQKERDIVFAGLLQYDGPVNRTFLLEELVSNEILSKVHPQIETLYNLIEGKFKPLSFGKDLASSLKFISSIRSLQQYHASILDVSFLKLLIQLSTLYESISIKHITNIFPLLPYTELERKIIDAIVNRIVECRIDHRKGIIRFFCFSFESDQLRFKLSQIAKNLRKCVDTINPEIKTQAAEKKKLAYVQLAQNLQEEHKKVLERKSLIEKIKELREAQEAKAAKQAEEAKRREAAKMAKLEAERLEQIRALRSKNREQALAEEKKRKENEELAKKINEIAKATGAKPPKLLAKDIKNENIGTDDMVKISVKEVLKQRKKKEEVLNSLGVKLDHLVRAQRELEIPLLQQKADEQAKEDEKFWNEQREKFLQHDKEQYEERLETKKRLDRMTEGRNQFQKMMEEKKRKIYEEKKKERDQKVSEYYAKKAKEDEKRKEEDRKRQEEEDKRKEEERKREEEKRREEERRRQEDEERKKEEERKREEERLREEKRLEEETKKVAKFVPSRLKESQGTQPPLSSSARPAATRPETSGAANWRNQKKDVPLSPRKEVPAANIGGKWKPNPADKPATVEPVDNETKEAPPSQVISKSEPDSLPSKLPAPKPTTATPSQKPDSTKSNAAPVRPWTRGPAGTAAPKPVEQVKTESAPIESSTVEEEKETTEADDNKVTSDKDVRASGRGGRIPEGAGRMYPSRGGRETVERGRGGTSDRGARGSGDRGGRGSGDRGGRGPSDRGGRGTGDRGGRTGDRAGRIDSTAGRGGRTPVPKEESTTPSSKGGRTPAPKEEAPEDNGDGWVSAASMKKRKK